MPAFATITVNDREATPVAHSFTPRMENAGTFEWRESNGVPIGDGKFTLSLRQNENGNYKARIRLEMPVVVNETINGVTVPKVERMSMADVMFTFSERSTTQERKNTVGLLANALAASQAQINSVLTDLENIY